MYKIDKDGIKIPTLQELIEKKTNEFKIIYGNDINVEQNTPDGQLINIEAQAETDLGEFLLGVYNSFDPDVAVGRELDRVVSYKGLSRKGATYTQLNISITTDRACEVKAGFIVSDDVGNNFILANDFTCGEAGIYITLFQSATAGEVTVELNAVKNIVTPVLGIVGVINNSNPVNIGVNEESDFELRSRFSGSVALNGKSGADNLYSQLLNVANVTSCYIDNNRTNETNRYGTPPHSIWAIVNGGDDGAIANAVYSTISDGCGMRGEIEVDILDDLGNTQQVFFDRVSFEDLYIKFKVYGKSPSVIIDEDKIKLDLLNSIKINANMEIDKNYINIVLTNNNNTLIYSEIKLSKDGENWFDFVNNTNLNYQFNLTTDNIIIEIENYINKMV
jgi:uncharacterized phage protein gp47/JayE